MVSSNGYIEEYPPGFKGLRLMDKSKSSKEEYPAVSIDSMISTMRNEEGYPDGLKVLVVDENVEFLDQLKTMLQECNYIGIMCSSASEALSMLGDKSRKFDIIVMAILDNDKEGFKQIQQFAREADLPIRYLLPKDTSALDAETIDLLGENFCKLSKPICLRSVQCLWFPVAKKREDYIRKLVKAGLIDFWEGSAISKLLYSRWGDDGSLKKLVELIQKVEEEGEDSKNVEVEEHDTSLLPNKKPKIQKGEDHMDVKVEEHHTSLFLNRKPKIPWVASDLHGEFLLAVAQLGSHKADAAKILELMNFPSGLTRKLVDIHLKEYQFLRQNFAGGHPSKMPFDEVPVSLCARSSCFKDGVNFWRTYCGSYDAV
ncbi:hypothetical protein MKW94_019128 [Papaver nudicaule]|uniref:Response regulatory domain-containing protein n=1 Tax=Papaver nudicaule TaxID=74823 RepID=A0AA41W0C6_PAPNU|nr:hypothetical protein [Papaver nudicaule]